VHKLSGRGREGKKGKFCGAPPGTHPNGDDESFFVNFVELRYREVQHSPGPDDPGPPAEQ